MFPHCDWSWSSSLISFRFIAEIPARAERYNSTDSTHLILLKTMHILHVTQNRKCTILHTFVSSILILICLLLSISKGIRITKPSAFRFRKKKTLKLCFWLSYPNTLFWPSFFPILSAIQLMTRNRPPGSSYIGSNYKYYPRLGYPFSQRTHLKKGLFVWPWL